MEGYNLEPQVGTRYQFLLVKTKLELNLIFGTGTRVLVFFKELEP